MNYRNSETAEFLQSLTSEYRGPRILNFAGNGEEEEETEETEETTEEVTPPEGEQETTEETETETETGEEDEDPLETPNPFEEGSAQHQAFEKQREKFRIKLEKETTAAKATAAGDISGKLDQLLTALTGGAAPAPKPAPAPGKQAPKVKLTEEDRAIVTGVLSEIGLDPEQIVKERRRAEVASACADLRKDYPDAEFDDVTLVKFANEAGISKMGGTPYDILELALVRMQRTKKSAGGGTPPAPKPAPKKKEAPPISGSSTKQKPSAPEGDKPKTMQSLKDRILRKRGAK